MAKYGTPAYYFVNMIIGQISNPAVIISDVFIANLSNKTRRMFSDKREELANVIHLAFRFENYEKKRASNI